MKKILFVAAIAAITFTSCKKDDDNGTECFDCTQATVTTEICHTDGDDFYTMTTDGNSVEQTIPSGITWSQMKATLTATCN